MTLLSVTAFAKTHGVSKAAAQKWQAKGCLAFREGKVEVERSDQLLQHAGLGRFNRAATGSQGQPATGNRVAAEVAEKLPGELPPDADLNDPEVVRSLTAFVNQLLTGDFADFNTAEMVKANALALKHVLAARKEAGLLVDLETAEKAMFEASRQARDAWLNFPTRVGPRIAAELNIDADKLVETLTVHVHQQLTDIGEPEVAFGGDGAASAGLPQGADAAAED